ncbi:MAG TPA: DUF4286 family protein [Phycisphaerae bacterium]|jgi:hypothetical protein
MSHILYEVTATFSDPAAIDPWLNWILSEHIQEVVRCGAECGRAVRLEEPPNVCLVQYEFPSRDALEHYLRDDAPRLRQEGGQRFGPATVSYSRRIGHIRTPHVADPPWRARGG